MPKPLLRLLPAAACLLLPGLLHAAAQLSPPAALSDGRESGSYTVQAGDTLAGIARKHGLTPDELARANALERPDKIIVGNVLRLPVTPPQQAGQFMPVQTTAPAANEPKPFVPAPPQPVAVEPSPPTPAKPAAPAQPAQAKPAAPAQPPVQAKAVVPAAAPVKAPAPEPAPAQAKPAVAPQVPAAKPQAPPAKAAPSAAAVVEAPRGLPPEPRTKAAEPTEIAARLAVGSYANPTLGALRVSQTPTGIAVSRENQTIPMRHLLYGVFDGTDGAGGIHGLSLQYDEDGQVRALLYSSASGKDIPFARVKK